MTTRMLPHRRRMNRHRLAQRSIWESLEDRTLLASIVDLGDLGGGSSYADAVNESGQVIGNANTASGEYHAYFYSGGTMTDLGDLVFTNPERDYDAQGWLNNSGQVIGNADSSSVDHAFLYSGKVITDLGTLGGTYSQASAINDSGQVVGESTDVDRHEHAFLYSRGVMTNLGTLGGHSSWANAINNSGQVVGGSYIGGEYAEWHAFLYSDGVMTDLGPFFEGTSEANAINESGQVVGWTDTPSEGLGFDAFLYSGGTMTVLGTLGRTYSDASAINNSGDVIGESYNSDGSSHAHAFLYSRGVMTDLGTLGGDSSWANAINNSGQVVGSAATASGSRHAFLYSNGKMTDLNSLLPANSGWTLTDAEAINDHGEIVGTGVHNSKTHAYLLNLHPPILILPGIAGTFPVNSRVHDWYVNRGIGPDALQIDSLGHVYDDLIQTLENAGYRLGHDLFVATYDWRVPPAQDDGSTDGHIDVTASQIMDDVGQGHYKSGLDYLGYWLKQAADAWANDHKGEPPLDSVDIIAHSTGGLIARTYIQSDAYGGVYDNLDNKALPKVHDFVMLDVPNEGASKAWNPLHDDWAVDPVYVFVLSKFINEAFKKLKKGEIIHGWDYNIASSDIYERNQAGQIVYDPSGQPRLDKVKFVSLYVPTIRSLLATYPFLDSGSGVSNDVDSDPSQRNSLVLDLNGGSDPISFVTTLGKDGGQVLDVFGDGEETPFTVTQRTATGSIQDDDAVVSFTEYAAHAPPKGDIYYQDNFSASGDGTVPLLSMIGLFDSNPNVILAGFTNGVSSGPEKHTDEDIGHTGIVSNPDAQKQILGFLGANANGVKISMGHWYDIARHISQVGTVYHDLLHISNDPVEFMLTDAEGRRFGYTHATGIVTEIPNSVYIGQADGFGYVFGPLAGPLTLQLIGLGADYSLEFDALQDNTYTHYATSGMLAASELKSLNIDLSPRKTIAVQPSLESPTYGYPLTFTATVAADSPDAGTPTGAVQFLIDGADFGVPVALVNGAAMSGPIASLGAGPHTLSAVYSGDSTFTSGTADDLNLIVTKAHLTVSADDHSKSYDGSPFTGFTVHYIGFVNGETQVVVDGQPSFSGTAVGAVNTGSYTITPGPGNLSSTNYDFTTFIAGTLTITPTSTPAPTPPLVTMTNVQIVFNKKHQVSQIVVTFSGPVDATEAQQPGIYRPTIAGKKGSFTAKNAKLIALKSAAYNAANDTVTLTLKKPFKLSKPVQLQVSGLSPSGLKDTSGRLIDGNRDGQPGGNAVAVLGRGGATISAVVYQGMGTVPSFEPSAVDALLEQEDPTGWRPSARAKHSRTIG